MAVIGNEEGHKAARACKRLNGRFKFLQGFSFGEAREVLRPPWAKLLLECAPECFERLSGGYAHVDRADVTDGSHS